MHYLKISNINDYNEFEVSYLCIILSIYYILLSGKVHVDWLQNRHEDWLGIRYDWLGLCPTIHNLGYTTDLGVVHNFQPFSERTNRMLGGGGNTTCML